MLPPLERLGVLERVDEPELLDGLLLGVVDGRLLLLEGEVVVGRLLLLGVLVRLLLLDGEVVVGRLLRLGVLVRLLLLDEEGVVTLLELLVGDVELEP